MNLSAFIAELTARTDDVLAGVTDRKVARELLLDELTLDYPNLPSGPRAEIVRGVLAALDDDDFFGWEFCGDPFAEEWTDSETF